MAPIDDETLDRLLTRHVGSRLEGQVGRAETAFRQRLVEQTAPAAPMRLAGEKPARSGRFFPHWNMRWLAGMAATAVAASLATLFLLPHLLGPMPNTGRNPTVAGTGSQSGPLTPSVPISPVATSEHPMVRYVYNQAWDEGTVTTDNSGAPARRVRYQQVEHYRYYDPQRRANVDVVVPHEDIQDYELDTY